MEMQEILMKLDRIEKKLDIIEKKLDLIDHQKDFSFMPRRPEPRQPEPIYITSHGEQIKKRFDEFDKAKNKMDDPVFRF
jgi:hypothetical protein